MCRSAHLQGGAQWGRAARGLQAVGGGVVGLVNGLGLGSLNVATICKRAGMSHVCCSGKTLPKVPKDFSVC